MFHLGGSDIDALFEYLRSRDEKFQNESLLSTEKPGEGNMNYVLRIRYDSESFILKQARPYVEKYPSIPAPVERIVTEASFYKTIQQDPLLKTQTPLLLWTDEKNSLIALEDLGAASDYSVMYTKQKQLSSGEAEQLLSFLSALHKHGKDKSEKAFYNKAMKQLNHQHIFLFPFMEENGFDLDVVQPGLQSLAMKFKTNAAIHEATAALGAIYIANGNTLLHGDYYPGSWLLTTKGIRIIDPEFCFYGPAVFDYAVMKAHCILSLQSENILQMIDNAVNNLHCDEKLLYDKFTSVEIMRRLIGLAQLPLCHSIEQKEALLQQAAQNLL